jgi:hypothetical protein
MHRLPWCDACAPRWIIFGAVHANSCLAVNADATHQSISGCDIGALGRRFRVLGCVCEAPAAGRACRGYVRCLWRRLPASCVHSCVVVGLQAACVSCWGRARRGRLLPRCSRYVRVPCTWLVVCCAAAAVSHRIAPAQQSDLRDKIKRVTVAGISVRAPRLRRAAHVLLAQLCERAGDVM